MRRRPAFRCEGRRRGQTHTPPWKVNKHETPNEAVIITRIDTTICFVVQYNTRYMYAFRALALVRELCCLYMYLPPSLYRSPSPSPCLFLSLAPHFSLSLLESNMYLSLPLSFYPSISTSKYISISISISPSRSSCLSPREQGSTVVAEREQ